MGKNSGGRDHGNAPGGNLFSYCEEISNPWSNGRGHQRVTVTSLWQPRSPQTGRHSFLMEARKHRGMIQKTRLQEVSKGIPNMLGVLWGP